MDEREKRLAEKMEFAVDGIWLSHKNSFGLVTKEPASWQVISLWSECLRLMAERENWFLASGKHGYEIDAGLPTEGGEE